MNPQKNLYLVTSIGSAAENGHLIVYQFLVRNVEDKNPENQDGLTPLSYAAMKNNYLLFWRILHWIPRRS